MARIAYYRVSTSDQSIEAQRHALGGNFDKEFSDEGVSGITLAANRPGFGKLLDYAREGDEVHVFAVDRLGRDALDVQTTVRRLMEKGVAVHVLGLGVIAPDDGVSELILSVFAQFASLERRRMIARAQAGRDRARAELEATGVTHNGKQSLGRRPLHDAATVCEWREKNRASISQTARHFNVSTATVKRYFGKQSLEGQSTPA